MSEVTDTPEPPVTHAPGAITACAVLCTSARLNAIATALSFSPSVGFAIDAVDVLCTISVSSAATVTTPRVFSSAVPSTSDCTTFVTSVTAGAAVSSNEFGRFIPAGILCVSSCSIPLWSPCGASQFPLGFTT